jgi:putative ABC transport system permease protein
MREKPMWRRYLRLLRSDLASDVEDELEFHLKTREEELVRRGLTETEARRRAAEEFGNVEKVRAELGDIGRKRLQREHRARWWASLAQDVRFASRSLRTSPGFTSVVILTLALGIGGTTAIFSVVNSVLLAPLPYEEAGQLVRFYSRQDGSVNTATGGFLTGVHFREIRENASSFAEVAALYSYRETGLDIADGGRAERLRVLEVSSGYFRTLRARLVGPGLTREDETGAPRVVLSHRVWSSRFGEDVSLIGTEVRLSGQSYTVVGIAPEKFEDPVVGAVDAWLPLDLARPAANRPNNYFLSVIGRLRAGVDTARADAELQALNRSLEERASQAAGERVVMTPLKEDVVGASRNTLHLLLLAVALVLLVACVNVANLFLIRSIGRAREFAIRAALGSGGMRIARQLLVESLGLSLLGGALGLAVALFGVKGLVVLGREAIPRLDEVAFDPTVLGFAVVVSLATGTAFGVAPAFFSSRADPGRALREQSRSSTASRGKGRLRSGFAAAQLALALTLLVGAGALMSSVNRLRQVDLGIRSEDVLTFEVNLPALRYTAEQRAAVQEELDERLAAIAGVTAAGGVSRLPATGSFHSWGTRILGGGLVAGTDDSFMQAEQRVVSGRYLETLGIPVLAGRSFDSRDDLDAPPRAVVSAAFALTAFPDLPLEQVVGRRINPSERELEIIGVVADVAIDARGRVEPTVYQAHRQFAADRNWSLTHVVAADLPPDRILPAVRAELAAIDPELVVHRPTPLEDVVGRGIGRERFVLALMAAFSGVALMLAALGLYGVLSYSVRQRRQEIGIRMALGATAAGVRRLVLRQAAFMVAIGTAAGAAGALALGRWLAALEFEIIPWDWGIFAGTALLLTMVALASAWLPAWRAARIEPRTSMQAD